MLGKDAVQRGAGFRVNSLVQVNAAYFGAGVWLINVLRPPPPRSSSRGTEGSNPSRSSGESAANYGHRGDADELDARGMKSKSRTSVRLHAIGS